MQVLFKINKVETKDGFRPYIVGEHPLLGAWNVSVSFNNILMTLI